MQRATAWVLTALAAALLVGHAGAAPAESPYSPKVAEVLAIRMAQVDAVNRLTDRVLSARLAGGKTVGAVLGHGSRGEIDLRVFLRTARRVGPPRVYSDAVAECDVHVPVDVLTQKVVALCGQDAGAPDVLALGDGAIDGYLGQSGSGRPVPGLPEEVIGRVMAAPPEVLPEMFPAGWERVTGTGRVLAVRAARVAAYEAMAVRLRAILLAPSESVGDLVGNASASQAAFEAYVRSLAVTGEPRLMPDRIAEVEVSAPLRGLIEVLKDIRRLRLPETSVTEEQLDRLSVRIKSDAITVAGRGMPPQEATRPAAAPLVAGGQALPDWATTVLLATGTARLSRDETDPNRARLLAARSAKVRALADLDNQVNQVILQDGVTVRSRAATDAVFRSDLEVFLDSARTVRYRATDEGRVWEVVLRLPLLRLYACSRRSKE